MPLYTYIATYKGDTHVAQGRHSNFKGFPTWFANLPASALPGLSQKYRKDLNPYSGDFEPVPNQEKVWKKILVVDGNDLTVVVVETKG
jgi:hypothetical protein